MALLTDGYPNDTETLRVYESSILNVAHVEGIDLDAKLGLATEEISQQVLDVLLTHDSFTIIMGRRRLLGVSDVVVTSTLRRWHALHALAIVYRDAYNNQLNDRYKSKWEEYRELEREAKEQTLRFGIGLVSPPIRKADAPSFGIVPSLNPSTTYYVQVNWAAADGQEGCASDVTTYQTAEGSLMMIQVPSAPEGVAFWNAFVGLTPATIMQQNATPILVGQHFTIPSTGLVAGRRTSEGQAAQFYVTGGRILRRG
jgi:hypothetical protein